MNASGYTRRAEYQNAPPCVQNAMMTKDKKPFTYTPGGIDLREIKSERMAKRLARNAQADGSTRGARQKTQSNPSGTPILSSVGAAAMGLPCQVLPSAMSELTVREKKQNGNVPTAPPPPNGTTLESCNYHGLRKPFSPQRFEPPPMGSRPEIKIPTNPIANLKKVAPPVEKNTFWKEEYIRERSKSPLMGGSQNLNSEHENMIRSNDSSSGTFFDGERVVKNYEIDNGSLQSSNPETVNVGNEITIKSRKNSVPMLASTLPENNIEVGSSNPNELERPKNMVRLSGIPSPNTQVFYQLKPQEASLNPQRNAKEVPWRTQRMQQSKMQQKEQEQDPQNSSAIRKTTVGKNQTQNTECPRPASIGSLSIKKDTPPIRHHSSNFSNEPLQQEQKKQLPILQAASLPQQVHEPATWNTSQAQATEGVHCKDFTIPLALQYSYTPSTAQTYTTERFIQPQTSNPDEMATQHFGDRSNNQLPTNMHLQISNSSNRKSISRERIVPITLEDTPMNILPQQHFSSASPRYIRQPPNQFVDQGYNNYKHRHFEIPPRMPNIAQLASESEGNQSMHYPSPPATVAFQKDQRTPPVQSKSFKVLQQITGTAEDVKDPNKIAQNVKLNLLAQPIPLPHFDKQRIAKENRVSSKIEDMQQLRTGKNYAITNPYASKNHNIAELRSSSTISIPRRSFSTQQSIFNPENAGPGQSDL